MTQSKDGTLATGSSQTKNILWFKDISIADIPLVGGKNASLGEMYGKLTGKGVNVPNGFAVSVDVYRQMMEKNNLKKKIKETLKGLEVTNVRDLTKRGKKIRAMILKASFPEAAERDIVAAYHALHPNSTKKNTLSVAVRSSATAEDLPDASFAGQQETFLNVVGEKELLLAVKRCIASLFTDRAISYRETKGFDHLAVGLSVGVQAMVRSDLSASGVLFTLDTESGFPGVVLLNASYGLGEYIVKGQVTPDQFYVFKAGIRQGKTAIVSRILGTKEVKLVYGKRKATEQVKVRKNDRDRFCLSDQDIMTLARWGMQIEEHYGRPQDIEWAKDGQTGELFIVQARPETVTARVNRSEIEHYELKQTGQILLRGTAVGQKIGAGRVRIIENPKQMKDFKKGDILVTRLTDPDWEPIMRVASAIITEQGGKTSHAAIVSRELGVPCVVGAANARKLLANSQQITVSCAEGDEGKIYKGILPFEVKRTAIGSVPKTKTLIMMNMGDPDNAFPLSFLPSDGVGLAREEFIFTNFIRIHPLALVHYDKLKDKAAKKKIDQLTRGYKKKTDYCVDKLAEGMSRIAVAMYPKPVIIRLSDFKTNEYATLIGGKEFEPKEENPMLGWRGASRYYSKEYREGFRLECEAIKKARNDWGLTNIIVMVPFCRTPEEGEKTLSTMAEFGLKQGENDLKVYVMCEIPSNVILAEDFAKLFDGFSIGSNDLTMLTLGVDRDSPLVANVYDEKNEAVKELIRNVIRVAHKNKKPVGICGQAPSDHPEFAEFLVQAGVDSISLNPDTVLATRERIALVEKTLGKTGNKTSIPSLTAVSVVALLAASIMALGAGCQEKFVREEMQEVSQTQGATAAQIREQAEARVRAEYAAAEAGKMATLREQSFAHFSLQYPEAWTVEHWNGGVVLRDTATSQYVSIYKQLLPRAQGRLEAIESILVGGMRGTAWKTVAAGGSGEEAYEVSVIQVQLEGSGTLEINSNSERLNDIMSTFTFVSTTIQNERPATLWDVREKRLCVPMLTFACPVSPPRFIENLQAGDGCDEFRSPCDVPEGWKVSSGQERL